MNIRTKLRGSSIIITGLILIFIGVEIFFMVTLQASHKKQQLAQKITEASFQLALLRSEYKAHPSERPKVQWINMYETQTRLLDEAAPLFTTPEEKTLFNDTRAVSTDSRKLFGELIRNIEQEGSETVIEELSNQLTIKAQARVSNALRLSELARAQASNAQNQFGFVTTALGIIIVVISIVFYAVGNSMIQALQKLGENFTRIVTLDFSPTTTTTTNTTNDELGELAQVFNQMAGRLKNSYTTLEQKVSDRTQDLKKFQLAVEDASDHITITDAAGTIIYANPAVELLTGFTREEVVGKKAGSRELWGGLMGKEFYKKLWHTIKVEKRPFLGEIKNKRKNGSTFISRASIYPVLNDSGTVNFFVEVHHDITKEKAVDKAKTEFVSLASHQLRTPLVTIKWYIEMLASKKSGHLNTDQQKYLHEIAEGNRHIIELVNALLDVSRLELGTLPIEVQPTNYADLVKKIVRELTPDTNSKHLKLQATYSHDVPIINADQNLLRIIVQNILSNAIKYTPDKGTVNLSLAKHGNDIQLRVQDTGLGIPSHEQSQIFTKLFRAENVRARDTTGTGLGLYIVKSILEQVGGKVWFESIEGRGTIFYISLPISGMTTKGAQGNS